LTGSARVNPGHARPHQPDIVGIPHRKRNRRSVSHQETGDREQESGIRNQETEKTKTTQALPDSCLLSLSPDHWLLTTTGLSGWPCRDTLNSVSQFHCLFAAEVIMSQQDVSPEAKQSRMTEFLKLLPLTLELAGLPKGDAGRTFTPDQIEGRAMAIRSAYKAARNLIKDIGDHGA
jgi:hypothetical protein